MPIISGISLTLIVSYNANGGSGAPANTTRAVSVSDSPLPRSERVSVNISSAIPTRNGYRFIGWGLTSGAETGQQPGSVYSHTFQLTSTTAQTYSKTLYAIWEEDRVRVYFNANGGSGAPSSVTPLRGVSFKLPTTVPTYAGHKFVGWAKNSAGTGTIYAAGASYVANSNTETLYAVWEEQGSTFTLSKTRVKMDNSDSCTVTITKATSSIDHHTVKVSFGNVNQTFENVGTSKAFTIPLNWNNKVPNATEGVAKITVTSFLANGDQFGSAFEKNVTLVVPSTVVPTLSVSYTQMGNETAKSWGVYLQSYSSVKFTASASGAYSSTISSIEIKGPGLSVKADGNSIEATSDVFTSYGDLSYSIIAIDSRGRSKTVTRTIAVEAYHKPSLVGGKFYRSNSSGVKDEIEGAYLTVKYTSVNLACSSHNSATVVYSYALYQSSSYTTISNNAQPNTNYTVSADIAKTYIVKTRITDALGTYTQTETKVNSVVCSLALGLNNDRARFGGACRQAGLEVDWNTQIRGNLTVDGSINTIGDRITVQPDALSVQSSSWTSVANAAFEVGVYVIMFGCVFDQNSTGIRRVNISSNQNSSSTQVRGSAVSLSAVSGSPTYASAFTILTFSNSTTLYINCYQTSGSSLSVSPWIRAVKIS